MQHIRYQAVIVACSLILFLPYIGSVNLFDWDEVNFAECAREMIVTGDFLRVQVDYQPFYEKPPLFIWMQVVSMKLFGVSAFAARFPNVLVGMATLLLAFSIGARIHSARFGLMWCIAYAGSLLPHFYFRSGIIDPLFNFFIFASIWCLIRGLTEPRSWVKYSVIGGICSGCAVLTKGPVGLGLVLITAVVAWIVMRREYSLPWKQLGVVAGVALIIPSFWFGAEFFRNGPSFMTENIAYQWRLLTSGEAGHEQPWYYHPLVLLLGCYPASIIFLAGFRKDSSEDATKRLMRLWMIALFFVVLVVFSLVKTKIVHYSSMAYLPMTYLAANAIERYLQQRSHVSWWTISALVFVGLIVSFAAFIVPWAFSHPNILLGLSTFRDEYLRSAITLNVGWHGWEPYLSLIFVVGLAIAVLFMRRHRPLASMVALFGSTALFSVLFLPFVAPRIEPYTQGTAINFYKSLRGKEVYVKPLTMKSYAHLFYADKPLHLSARGKGIEADQWEPWLLNGDIDKPAYFVCKVNDASSWRKHPSLRVIEEKGGFVFFERIRALPGLQTHSH